MPPLQHVADEIGVDLLHIKGAAVDPSPAARPAMRGTDVDVLVRPDALRTGSIRRCGSTAGGSTARSTYGSPFGHAQTYMHDAWGYIDVHRFFPGIRLAPEAASSGCGATAQRVEIAGVGCPVPSIARAVAAAHPERGAVGRRRQSNDLSPSSGSDARRRASHARSRRSWPTSTRRVAFAAATGGLERYRGERDYRLWKVVSEGGSRSAEWWARVRAAPTLAAALRVVVPARRS